MKVSLLVIRCKNIEESKEFYEQLGLVFIKEQHGTGPEHYSSEDGGIVFELYPNNAEAPNDNTRLGFKVNNIQATISALTITNTYEFNGKTVYVVTDPDGRKIEVN